MKMKKNRDDVPEASADTPPTTSSRRNFLIKSVAMLPAAGALTACDSRSDNRAATTSGNQSGTAQAAEAPAYQTQYFNADEYKFIEAAVDVLIPADAEGPGAVELGVPEFIDRQMSAGFGHAADWYMQGPFHPDAPVLSGYQSSMTPRQLYRAGIAALNAHCQSQFGGKAFAQLSPADRDKLLHDLDGGKLKLDNVSARNFFNMLLANTKEGYFSDPIHGGNKNGGSWKMIGFPGARADFLDWVTQPGKVYPLGTVTIAGT
jgi:gluconate 2-dehydrogenase gamma chain